MNEYISFAILLFVIVIACGGWALLTILVISLNYEHWLIKAAGVVIWFAWTIFAFPAIFLVEQYLKELK